MPRADLPPPEPAPRLAPAATALLARLARRGAVLSLQSATDAAITDAAISDAGTGAASPLGDDARPLVAAAIAAGHLEPSGSGYRLSASGRALVRRARLAATVAAAAAPTTPAGSARPRSAAPAADRAPPAAAAPARNDAESPLGWLRRRRDRDGRPLVEPELLDAGERLRADLWFARMTPRVTAPWSGVPSDRGARGAPGAGMEMADRIVAARQRVASALDVVGPELSGILVDVCGHLKGLEEIERSEGWPQRSAKLVLMKALTALARHYGMLPPVTAADTVSRRRRHWGTDDYRPTLDRWRTP